MLDFPLMLRVKLPLFDRIHPQSNKFATGVENRATGDLNVTDSPDYDIPFLAHVYVHCMSQVEHRDIRWCEEPGLPLKLASSSLCSTHNLKEFISEQIVITSETISDSAECNLRL